LVLGIVFVAAAVLVFFVNKLGACVSEDQLAEVQKMEEQDETLRRLRERKKRLEELKEKNKESVADVVRNVFT
jgi:Na+-transporting methylmalonyl-CoA/oxaloacetate decarboxylase gamma subunit